MRTAALLTVVFVAIAFVVAKISVNSDRCNQAFRPQEAIECGAGMYGDNVAWCATRDGGTRAVKFQ